MKNLTPAQIIKAELKSLGYKVSKISCRNDSYSMGSSTHIEIKDPTINLHDIKAIANKQKSVRYDEYLGEILSGGNHFVDVSYSREAIKEGSLQHMELAQEFWDERKRANAKGCSGSKTIGGFIIFNDKWENIFELSYGDYRHGYIQNVEAMAEAIFLAYVSKNRKQEVEVEVEEVEEEVEVQEVQEEVKPDTKELLAKDIKETSELLAKAQKAWDLEQENFRIALERKCEAAKNFLTIKENANQVLKRSKETLEEIEKEEASEKNKIEFFVGYMEKIKKVALEVGESPITIALAMAEKAKNSPLAKKEWGVEEQFSEIVQRLQFEELGIPY